MQTQSVATSPQKSVHSINGTPWVSALRRTVETSPQAPGTFFYDRLKILGYVGVPTKEFTRKLDEWVSAGWITSEGPHLYGSRYPEAPPAPRQSPVVPMAFQQPVYQAQPQAPVMAPVMAPPAPPHQSKWVPQPMVAQPGIPPQAVSFDEKVHNLMNQHCLRQPIFVVEKFIQSMLQKDMNQLIHIKTIGEAMRSFADRNPQLCRWADRDGFTGESIGYALEGILPPTDAWMRIG